MQFITSAQWITLFQGVDVQTPAFQFVHQENLILHKVNMKSQIVMQLMIVDTFIWVVSGVDFSTWLRKNTFSYLKKIK